MMRCLKVSCPFLPTVSGVNTWGYFSLYKGFITVLLLRVMLCGLLKSALRARRTFWFAGLYFRFDICYFYAKQNNIFYQGVM